MVAPKPTLLKNPRLTGSGDQTLILSHGFGTDQTVWDRILPYLSQHHRVLVFDWDFSGRYCLEHSWLEAFSDELAELLDEMGLKKSVYVGHSLGGLVGCLAAVKRGDLFKKLVLINSSPRYLNCEDYEGGSERDELEHIFSSIESNFHAWALSFASIAVGPTDPLSVEKFRESLGRMNPSVAPSLAKAVFGCDKRDILEKVENPCAIIQSSDDFVVPTSVAYYMQKKIKARSTVEIVEAHGHFLQLTAHELLLNALERALGCDAKEDTE